MKRLPAIDFAAMANSDDKDGYYIIPDGTDDTVVTHPVLPELAELLAGQRLPEGARIIQRSDPFPQHLDNPTLNDTVKLTELIHSLRLEFNSPGQDAAPLHPAGCPAFLT